MIAIARPPIAIEAEPIEPVLTDRALELVALLCVARAEKYGTDDQTEGDR